METWLAFIGGLAGSIAWPLCVLIIALLFRQSLTTLLSGLRQLRLGGVELQVERLDAINDTIAETAGIKALQVSPPALDADMEKMAKIKPAAAILYAWTKIEQAVTEKMRLIDPSANLYLVNNLPRLLFKYQKINQETFEALNEMRKIRNDVGHYNTEADEKTAAAYCKNAVLLIAVINSIPAGGD
jgi:hypothetical protein